MYDNDKRTVITLDAGGTNFVFGAIRANEEIIEPIILPSRSAVLEECLGSLVEGFSQVIGQLNEQPVAISFAFPGPADYPNGVIGGYLPNFPSFRDGVALGPFLEEKFGIPVYINNDGDLYAYGEALSGALPEVNRKLREAGSEKQYHNLIGYTFGTGTGIGLISGERLHMGDNSCVETFCLRHKLMPNTMLEDGVSIRAVTRVYGEKSGDKSHELSPKQIYDIAKGDSPGDRQAALSAFELLGEVAGNAIADAVTMFDGLVVIGGGLAAARDLWMPALLREMRTEIKSVGGDTLRRVQMNIYDLDDEDQFAEFAAGASRKIRIYGSDRTVSYDPEKRTGIMTSRLGTSRAIALGAYAYALSSIDINQ